jgi:hypothetical protein
MHAWYFNFFIKKRYVDIVLEKKMGEVACMHACISRIRYAYVRERGAWMDKRISVLRAMIRHLVQCRGTDMRLHSVGLEIVEEIQ